MLAQNFILPLSYTISTQMSRDKLSDHAKKSSLPTAMGSSKEFSQGTTRREACKAGAVIYPTASQPWDRTRQAGRRSPGGATSGCIRKFAMATGGRFLPREFPAAAPSGADDRCRLSASHGWLAVG